MLQCYFLRLHPLIFREILPFNPIQENAMPAPYHSIEDRLNRYLTGLTFNTLLRRQNAL
jgi:hypothetical protein